MNGDLERVLDRVRQNRTAQAEASRDAATSTPFIARIGGRMFLAGDRVFDTVSGQSGIVEASSASAPTDSALITVRLERGGVVIRPPAQLVLRPTPPDPRPEATR